MVDGRHHGGARDASPPQQVPGLRDEDRARGRALVARELVGQRVDDPAGQLEPLARGDGVEVRDRDREVEPGAAALDRHRHLPSDGVVERLLERQEVDDLLAGHRQEDVPGLQDAAGGAPRDDPFDDERSRAPRGGVGGRASSPGARGGGPERRLAADREAQPAALVKALEDKGGLQVPAGDDRGPRGSRGG